MVLEENIFGKNTSCLEFLLLALHSDHASSQVVTISRLRNPIWPASQPVRGILISVKATLEPAIFAQSKVRRMQTSIPERRR